MYTEAGMSIYVFFKDVNDKDLIIAAKEAVFAYHTGIRGLSCTAADCTSKFILRIF
jgi:hypothetical protein